MVIDSPVRLEEVCVEVGSFRLDSISLEVRPGEYLVILGPTGCGKTVLLETLLGLHSPSRGRVLLGGRDAVGSPPEQRNLGYIPQDYALFPTMTVRQNLAFGPEIRRWPGAEVHSRVEELLDLLALAHLADRLPAHLSGGEKQRVALGRALAVHPRTLILDEPLSALDTGRRSELAGQLRSLQRRLQGSFLHVCHDLDEALRVADRIAIMRDGCLVQVGAPEEVLQRPLDAFVARFTGNPNVFPVRSASGRQVALEDGTLLATSHPARTTAAAIRPEALRLLEDGAQTGPATVLEGRVLERIRRSLALEVKVRTEPGGSVWTLLAPHGCTASPGSSVRLAVPPDAVWCLPEEASEAPSWGRRLKPRWEGRSRGL